MCITLYFAKLQKILIKDKSAHSFYREKFFREKRTPKKAKNSKIEHLV